MMHDGHEFEDRNTQLPADPRPLGAGVRPGALDGVPLGTPDLDYDVRSTFAVRPVNAFDFLQSQTVGGTATGEDSATWEFLFTVPKGFVAVVNWYQWFSDGGALNIYNYSGSLTRNKVNFPYNNDVLLGPQSDRMPGYMLVDEEQTYGVFVVGTGLQTMGNGSLTIAGTYILKTGRAYPYEIANPVGRTRHSVIAPEALAPTAPTAIVEAQEPAPTKAPPVRGQRWIKHTVPGTTPASQPQPASQPPPSKPPFDITWIKQTSFALGQLTPVLQRLCKPAGGSMFWVPVVSINDGRSSRGLTEAEAQAWGNYIMTLPLPPSGGGGSYTRSAR